MNESTSLRNTLSPRRIIIFGLVIILAFVLYLGRLFILQIIQGSDWVAQAEENRIKNINLSAQRGVIYDRNGVVLARNIASEKAVHGQNAMAR